MAREAVGLYVKYTKLYGCWKCETKELWSNRKLYTRKKVNMKMESRPNNTMESEMLSICSQGILRSVKISVWRLQGFIVLILLYKASPSGTAHGRPPYRHYCNRLFLVKYSRFLCNAFTYAMDTCYRTPSTVQLHCRFPPKMHKRRKWLISTLLQSYSVIL